MDVGRVPDANSIPSAAFCLVKRLIRPAERFCERLVRETLGHAIKAASYHAAAAALLAENPERDIDVSLDDRVIDLVAEGIDVPLSMGRSPIVPGDGVHALWWHAIGSIRGGHFLLTRQLLGAETAI